MKLTENIQNLFLCFSCSPQEWKYVRKAGLLTYSGSDAFPVQYQWQRVSEPIFPLRPERSAYLSGRFGWLFSGERTYSSGNCRRFPRHSLLIPLTVRKRPGTIATTKKRIKKEFSKNKWLPCLQFYFLCISLPPNICGIRLTVRTADSHSANKGSIPLSRTEFPFNGFLSGSQSLCQYSLVISPLKFWWFLKQIMNCLTTALRMLSVQTWEKRYPAWFSEPAGYPRLNLT